MSHPLPSDAADALPASVRPLPADAGRLARLHGASAMAAAPLADFREALSGLMAGRATPLDFDEAFYLAVHADVREAVLRGDFCCGYEHFCHHGRAEGRAWSDHHLSARFGLANRYPTDFTEPRFMRPPPFAFPRLPVGAPGPGRLLLLMVDDLQEDLFYAGYAGFFAFFQEVAEGFDRVVVSVEAPGFEAGLAVRYLPGAEVVHVGGLADLGQRPDLVATYSHVTTARALAQFGDPARTLYFCQEYEPGFFPLGAGHAMAERSIRLSRNLVVSTGMLHRYLAARGLLAGARVCVTHPAVRPFEVVGGRSRRLFFYFRPEAFNQRNLPELVWAAAMRFCDTHEGYELYLVGTVRTAYSFTRGGNRVVVASKLPQDDYLALIGTCDAAVSLIYAPHPGVIAYQAAASGIPTVTNTYENRSADDLLRISDNLVPFDPVVDDLSEKLGQALSMPKGRPSYRPEAYGLPTPPAEVRRFVEAILADGG